MRSRQTSRTDKRESTLRGGRFQLSGLIPTRLGPKVTLLKSTAVNPWERMWLCVGPLVHSCVAFFCERYCLCHRLRTVRLIVSNLGVELQQVVESATCQ